FAIKVAAGKVSAVTGKTWSEGLTDSPQDYLVVPTQPWLDGFAVGKGVIRQFVAMPLGSGYSVEEQVTGKADVGGLQLQVFPMKPEDCFEKLIRNQLPEKFSDLVNELTRDVLRGFVMHRALSMHPCSPSPTVCEDMAMGLGAGGQMQQEIYADP